MLTRRSTMSISGGSAGSDYSWHLIPDFARTDVEVSVYFLGLNDVVYLSPVYDVWFSAHGTYSATIDGIKYIGSDDYVGVMACVEQYVICNLVVSKCSSPASIFSLANQLPVLNRTLGWNTAQEATADRMLGAVINSGVFNIVGLLGPQALWASNVVMANGSPGLPDDHWQTEVLGWFQTCLARMQLSILDYEFTSVGVKHLGPGVQPDTLRSNEGLNVAVGGVGFVWKACCARQGNSEKANTTRSHVVPHTLSHIRFSRPTSPQMLL